MNIINIDGLTGSGRPCVATIGFFDGVHRGHKFLISNITADAKERGLESTVITFDRHPRQVLNAEYQPMMLSTNDEKMAMLQRTGVDNCCVLHFDKAMAAMSARDFMEKVLRDKIGVRRLFIGYDHRFGHNCQEGFDDYVKYGEELGIEVVRSAAFVMNGISISSSVVRSLLAEGEVEMAAKCLGYHYWLSGKVVDGVKEGRRMGFPTANILMDDIKKLIPVNGVYAVVAALIGDGQKIERYKAMMNIGNRPTFDGTKTTMEVNLLGFNGDLYGKELCVAFVKRLREERRFASEAELARQLAADRAAVETIDMKL